MLLLVVLWCCLFLLLFRIDCVFYCGIPLAFLKLVPVGMTSVDNSIRV